MSIEDADQAALDMNELDPFIRVSDVPAPAVVVLVERYMAAGGLGSEFLGPSLPRGEGCFPLESAYAVKGLILGEMAGRLRHGYMALFRYRSGP